MDEEARIPVSDSLRSERTSIITFSLLAMLSVLLQLKQAAGTTSSLFDTHYTTMVILVVALVVYGGSLIGAIYIRKAHLNWDLEFMNKISLLSGALAVILELVILVPALGVAVLLFWIFWFVSFVVVSSYSYFKKLFTRVVEGVVHAFEKLKEYLNMKNPEEEESGLPK